MTLLVSIVAVALAAFFAALAWRLTREERLRSAARVAALGEAIDEATIAESIESVGVQPAFLTQERPASSRGGVIKVAVGFAGAVALIVAIATMSTSQERRASGPGAAPAAQDGSLELLSMRHDRSADTLTVTGLVRNGGTAPADRLIAVVFTFDRNGNFVASGRAPVEFLSLSPGDESPFRVSVPNVGDVGRYRVSFRTEAGIVRHVDRRQALVAHRAE
jgi:hypothetical protein